MRLREAEFRVLQHIRGNSIFEHNEGHIHLLLSGGKDSVALLEILTSIKNLQFSWSGLKIQLYLHHFNHKRRGHESDSDEEHCIDLAKQTGNPIEVYSWTQELEQQRLRGGNFHDIARNWRYATVRNYAEQLSPNGNWVIATAHHRRDHAESVLMNLTRGCSTTGLLGIEPWNRQKRLLRPLLWLDSNLSDRFISNKVLPHREDSSNLQADYARNKIRLNVIPGLIDVNPRFIEHIWLLSRDVECSLNASESQTLCSTAGQLKVRNEQIKSMNDLKRFISTATKGTKHVLTRDKLTNVFLHLRKAIANPHLHHRYNFALSEQFEIIVTAEFIEIKAYS